MSAQRKQLNEDQDRWERSRMLLSGAVQQIGPDDDLEDEEEAKVRRIVGECWLCADQLDPS